MDRKNYAMVVLSISLLASIGFNVMPDPTHYCDVREIKAYCFNLSSTGGTCYTLPEKQGGRRCSSIWQEIPEIEVINEVETFANNKNWKCPTDGGKITSYTKCQSGIYEGYLGELI